MSALRKIRFVINAGQKPRLLFSVLERRNGDLILVVRTAERIGYDHRGNPDDAILEQRYSIHVSPNSEEYSTIKQTLNTADGQSRNSWQLTNAIKKRTGFAMIYGRRPCRLDIKRFELEPNDKNEMCDLGSFDQQKRNLVYLVFIGHPDRPFIKSYGVGWRVVQRNFSNFRIVVLYHVMPLPPHRTSSAVGHVSTYSPSNPVTDKEELLKKSGGMDENGCQKLFEQSYCILGLDLIHRTKSERVGPNLRRFKTIVKKHLKANKVYSSTIWEPDRHLISDRDR
jgi:hypothetical protein